MIEIMISGRGGQGAVLASQILAKAFFSMGNEVQSFPSFGAERRGAPVSAFLRVSTEEITLRCGMQDPDWVILFDSSLLGNLNVQMTRMKGQSLLLNCTSIGVPENRESIGKVFSVDAASIAENLKLKTTSFSIVNTAMVGAFAKASGLVDIEQVVHAIGEMVPVKKEENVLAAKEAYSRVEEVFK